MGENPYHLITTPLIPINPPSPPMPLHLKIHSSASFSAQKTDAAASHRNRPKLRPKDQIQTQAKLEPSFITVSIFTISFHPLLVHNSSHPACLQTDSTSQFGQLALVGYVYLVPMVRMEEVLESLLSLLQHVVSGLMP